MGTIDSLKTVSEFLSALISHSDTVSALTPFPGAAPDE